MNATTKLRAWDGFRMTYFPLSRIYWYGEERGDYDLENIGTIMLFTGLHDKHGREIYEGDRVDNRHEEFVVTFGRQEFIDIDPSFGLTYVGFSPQLLEYHSELEVVGNIYEGEAT